MKSRWFAAVAVLIPLTVAGCSSGGGKPGGAKGAYITQSDAICADVFAKAKSMGNPQDQASAQKLADLWQDANNRLKALPMPGESVELARQFVTDTENLSLSYTAVAEAYQFNDQARVTRYDNDIVNIKKAAAKSAKDYGYRDCTTIND
ncbi:MAG: hypothetical protein V7605_221 [Acidimicrobiaceae bacterium]